MRMLRNLGLMVFVVCIAAFASGCGGGGGGGSAMMEEEMPPVMECPQGQVGTYPDCMAPPPTDAELIADAQDTLAGIVADAATREQAARLAANEVYAHLDATDAQIDLAIVYFLAAQDALADITAANAAVNAATTPAQAETALADARAALEDLLTAQTGVESIQIALQMPATPPPGQTVTDFTGGSPLIQHVRDNSIINEAVLSNLPNDTPRATLAVGVADGTTYVSSFPANTTTDGRTVIGELRVTAESISSVTRGTTALPSISGIGSGFDMKQEAADTTTYVNAYTDISQTRSVRVKTSLTGSGTNGDQPTFTEQEMADSDYLLLGIWLTVPSADTRAAKMGAFAYAGRAIPTTIDNLPLYDPNDPDLETDTELNMKNTSDDAVSFGITDFVDDNKDLNATYRGKVVGAYLVGGKAANLEASIELEAEFRNIGGTSGEGDISGTISSITAGGQSIDGYIDLVKPTSSFANVTGPVSGGASGVVANQPFSGTWQGQFFEPKYRRTTEQENVGTEQTPRNLTKYVYTPEAPGTFAGAFQVRKSGVEDAGIIGAFGAKR